MKKRILLVLIALSLFKAFAQDISFTLNAQSWDFFYDGSKYYKFSEKKYINFVTTNCYDEEGTIIDRMEENNFFSSSKLAYLVDESKHPYEIINFFVANEKGWISTDDIALFDSDYFSSFILTEPQEHYSKKWVPIWYNDLLTSEKKLEDYSNHYKRFKNSNEYSLVQIHNLAIQNAFLFFYSTDDVSIFSINKIKENSNIYVISCEIEKSKQIEFNEEYLKESFINLPNLAENRNCTFIIEQNGNRLRLYNGETKQLIIEFMQVSQEWINEMITYIKSDYTNKPAALKVIEEKLEHPWSDPTIGLHEGNTTNNTSSALTSSTTNVGVSKVMTVAENLKLRSAEATTSIVLNVMSAGTKVKILELGKEETIDGINSNWVKVEVISGRDRDGNIIRSGTTGWCYGGYLE